MHQSISADLEGPPEFFVTLKKLGLEFSISEDEATDLAFSMRPEGQESFHFSGPVYPAAFTATGLDGAASGVIAGLIGAFGLQLDENQLCLHAAALELNGKGIIIPAIFNAGKSSLAAVLGFNQCKILSDDAIIINLATGKISGFCLPIRLRQKYLHNASPELRKWVQQRLLFAGNRFVFIKPKTTPSDSIELDHILMLARDSSHQGEPNISPAPLSEALHRFVWHNISRNRSPHLMLKQLMHYLRDVSCFRLIYAEAEQTADWFLQQTLNFDPSEANIGSEAPNFAAFNERFHVEQVDEKLFVSDDDSSFIYELSESAYVIWRLAMEMQAREELLEALGVLYADADAATLEKSLDDAIPLLAQNQLLHPELAQRFAQQSLTLS